MNKVIDVLEVIRRGLTTFLSWRLRRFSHLLVLGTATDKGIDLLVSMTAELFEGLLCVKWWNLPQKYKVK